MRFRRRGTAVAFVPPDRRLRIPVLAPTGGSGRSALAYLLAAGLAEHARTLVVDTASPLASPWEDWLTRLAGDEGAAETVRTLGEASPVSAPQVFAAAAGVATGTGGQFAVLQTRPKTAPALVDLFAPRVAVVDTDVSLLAQLAATDEHALDWLSSPACAPLLCAPASAKGITDLSLAVHRLRHHDLPTERIWLAVVGIAAPEVPRRVQAGLTLLQPYVAGTVCVPHEPRLHAVGTPSWARSTPSLRACVGQLLRALTTQPAADINSATPRSRGSTPTTGGNHALAHPD